MNNSTSGQLVRDNNGSATVHRGDKRLISHVVVGQRQGFGSFLTLLLLLLLCGATFSYLFHYRSNLSPDDYSALVARYRGIDDDVDSTVNSNKVVVDLSKNDPSLQGLKQAACRTFLAPSLAGASSNHRRWGVYTAWDLPRKAAAQPVADTCWVVELPSQKDDVTDDDWHWLVSATVPSLSKDSMVICQGFGPLLQHQPDDETRAATSKFVLQRRQPVVARQQNDNNIKGAMTMLSVSTVTHHKVKAGAELTVDHGPNIEERTTTVVAPAVEPEWLRLHGHCLDGIAMDGRAARPFATEDVIATSPVLEVPQHALRRWRKYSIRAAASSTHDDTKNDTWYFPFGPGIGSLSWGSSNSTAATPNVALQWHPTEQLLLQVVALQHVAANEPLIWNHRQGILGRVPPLDTAVSEN